MALRDGKNYYEILGVTPDSDVSEIKAAYRKLARKYHPDVNNSPEAAAKFKTITEAYETLSDNVKRNQYNTLHGFFKSYKSSSSTSYKKSKEPKFEDRTVNKSSSKASENVKKDSPRQEEKKQSSPPPPPPPPQSSSSQRQTKNEKTKSKNLFSDIFEEFSRNSPKSKTAKNTPKNGSDITTDISLTLLESIRGTSRTVNVMHSYQCPKCRGRKFINGAKCNECNGTGEISEHKKITVKIPPNIKNGAKLRIKNEGNAGTDGGKNGDLFLKITVIHDSAMKYDGSDILVNLPITPFEAVLGTVVTIPAADGELKLKIPPKTNSGQKFRLAAQGLEKNGKKGDMIVTVTIEIPDTLSDDEIRLYEKLKKLSSSNIRENLLHE